MATAIVLCRRRLCVGTPLDSKRVRPSVYLSTTTTTTKSDGSIASLASSLQLSGLRAYTEEMEWAKKTRPTFGEKERESERPPVVFVFAFGAYVRQDYCVGSQLLLSLRNSTQELDAVCLFHRWSSSISHQETIIVSHFFNFSHSNHAP